MKGYDPSKNPDPVGWLGADEAARIDLVASYHRGARVRLPNVRLHATIHVIVENQLASAEPIVVATLSRLQREGLSRHDAVHAIGSVLAEHIYELLKMGHAPGHVDANAAYVDGLKKLTAAGWRQAG